MRNIAKIGARLKVRIILLDLLILISAQYSVNFRNSNLQPQSFSHWQSPLTGLPVACYQVRLRRGFDEWAPRTPIPYERVTQHLRGRRCPPDPLSNIFDHADVRFLKAEGFRHQALPGRIHVENGIGRGPVGAHGCVPGTRAMVGGDYTWGESRPDSLRDSTSADVEVRSVVVSFESSQIYYRKGGMETCFVESHAAAVKHNVVTVVRNLGRMKKYFQLKTVIPAKHRANAHAVPRMSAKGSGGRPPSCHANTTASSRNTLTKSPNPT
jgi:hypothetical protein